MKRIPCIKVSVVRDGSMCAESVTARDSGSMFKVLAEYFQHHDREEMLAVLLDAKHKIIGLHTVSIGSLTLSIVHPRGTFKAAIVAGSAAIVLAHNHPSGDPTPSAEDCTLTERLKQAGELLGIRVLDHIVVGDGKYFSFADQGKL